MSNFNCLAVSFFVARHRLSETLVYMKEQSREVQRIEARVYHWNPASAKVLEKNGFRLEARINASSVRWGKVADELVYVKLPKIAG